MKIGQQQIRVDRYAVIGYQDGYDLWDCLQQKQVYNKVVASTLEEATELCDSLIETTGERKSVWIVLETATFAN